MPSSNQDRRTSSSAGAALLYALVLAPQMVTSVPTSLAARDTSITSAEGLPQPRSEGSGIKLPLKRHDAHETTFDAALQKRRERTPQERLEWAKRQRSYVVNKWSGAFSTNRTSSSSDGLRKKRDYVGLIDAESDSYYYAQVDIGTPAQTMNLVLDTGSADLWLPTSDCSSSACSSLTKFDPSASSTHQSSSQTFEISYGSGQASGTMAGDTVTLGGYTVYSQSFAVANQIASGTVSAPASGIFGFAFQELSTAGVTPWWEVLVKQNKLSSNAFTFQLARTISSSTSTSSSSSSSSSSGVAGGVFTIGEIDSDQYSGDINYVDVPSSYQKYGYWSIMLDSYTVQGGSSQSVNSIACIDTGTTLIASSYSFAKSFYEQISDSVSLEDEYGSSYEGLYGFPCDSSIEASFTFGGVTYSVNSADMNYGAVDNSGSTCLGAVFGTEISDSTPDFIFGDAFLKNVFTVFDWDQPAVGFASLVDGKAQTVSSISGSASSSSSSSSTSTASAQRRQFGGGPGFGGPGGAGGGGGGYSSASTSDSWTSVSVQATAATGSGVYWASGISSPTASGQSVRTGSARLVSGAAPSGTIASVGNGLIAGFTVGFVAFFITLL